MKNQVANFIYKIFGEIKLQLRALKWRVTISFFLTLEAEMCFHSRDHCTDLSFVSAHPSPDTPSLSRSLSEPPHSSHSTAPVTSAPHNLIWWGQQPGACVQRVRERLEKSEGVKERNKELCCFCQQLAAEDHPILWTPTPATNRPSRRQRITRTPCVPYSHLPALIPSSGFFSTLERVWKGSSSRSVSVQE